MSKEMIKSAFFEKELAKETALITEVVLDALECDPVIIENSDVRTEYGRLIALMEEYSNRGWKRQQALSLEDKAKVEYFPLIVLERMVLKAGESLDNGRQEIARSYRMYRAVAERLDLAADPRSIAVLVREKLDEVWDLFEVKYQIDVEKLALQVGKINGALFPDSLE